MANTSALADRRADSLTGHDASFRSTRKIGYSLYPNCPDATSPDVCTAERMSLDSRRPGVVITEKTPQIRSFSRPRTATTEPLFDDLHESLMSSGTTAASSVGQPVPGIDHDLSSMPPFGLPSSAPAPADVVRPRSLRSVATRQSTAPPKKLALRPERRDSSDASSPKSDRDEYRISEGSSGSHGSTAPTDYNDTARVKQGPTLAPLQDRPLQDTADQMNTFYADDPKNFDLLVSPPEETPGEYSLEARNDKLFSREHLQHIFDDRKLLLHFSSFLHSHRPKSVRLLMYYLDAVKAIRAIAYANGITDSLDRMHGYDFSNVPPAPTANRALQKRADEAFDALVRDELPAYVTYTWIQVVHESVRRRITGTLAPHLREASEGLAEVFCLSDPSRADNPIVFASQEFQRTTQYGMNYCVGRNCRFLQGPRTDPHAVRRLAEAVRAGKEHSEVLLNYRRDGQPFMNLLMIAPLHDAQGTIRYYIGAQVDVSNLARDATDLEGLDRALASCEQRDPASEHGRGVRKNATLESLSEMFNQHELRTIRKYGGRMLSDQVDADMDRHNSIDSRPRLVLTDVTGEALEGSTADLAPEAVQDLRTSGRLQGPYRHYLLLRPYPSLRILFTSPSLRIPGMLQSPFLSRVGGSSRVRTELAQAFDEGRGVTAKIRWLTRVNAESEEGRSRWIHATPLLNHKGEVGVWMVVLVDAESRAGDGRTRFREPPPVGTTGGEEGCRGDRSKRATVGGSSLNHDQGQRWHTTSPETVRRTELRERDRGKGVARDSSPEDRERPTSGGSWSFRS